MTANDYGPVGGTARTLDRNKRDFTFHLFV